MSSTTTVSTSDGQRVTVTLPVPGRHMALNAVTVLAAAVEAGAPVAGAVRALGGYQGVRGHRLVRHARASLFRACFAPNRDQARPSLRTPSA